MSCTGDANRTAYVTESLKKIARRIRTYVEGTYEPSMPPQLLDNLTDELLVIASEADTSVSAEEPALTGNARLRLLAWTAADARGATRPLEKALALAVGKRLDRQAQSVQAVLLQAVECATQDREELVGGDCSPAYVKSTRAEIDARVRAAFKKAHDEIYVGFWELVELLPGAEAAARTAAAEAAAHTAALADADGDDMPLDVPADSPPPSSTRAEGRCDFEKDLRENGLRFPWRLVEEYMQQKDNTVPPDLVKALGREAVQSMWQSVGKVRETLAGERWWSYGLPYFVQNLLREKSLDQETIQELEAKVADTERERAALDSENDELLDENAKLRAELQAARLLLAQHERAGWGRGRHVRMGNSW